MDEPFGTEPEPIAIEPPPLPVAATPGPKPWGFWASLGWFALTFFGGGLIAGIAVLVAGLSDDYLDGDTLTASGLLSAAIVIVGLVGCIQLRSGWTVRDYAAIHAVNARTIFGWTALIVAWSAGFDAIQSLVGRPIVPDVMLHSYHTATVKPLLLVYIAIGAPVMEEFALRGFLYRGWAHSRLGAWGAVLLTSVLFAALHVQYDFVGIAFTGSIGFIFAIARLKTGSIVPGIVMHAMINLVASIETVWVATHSGAVTQV